MITIDFETRSKCDIRKSGAWRYSQDPTTDILCMAYRINKEPVQLWVNPRFDLPENYEVTRTQELKKQIESADKRIEKYTGDETKQHLLDKAHSEKQHALSLLNADGEYRVKFEYTTELPEFTKDIKLFKSLGGIMEAHNASFEQAIWNNILASRYGVFETTPFMWRDSLAVAAMHNLPLALDKAGAALNLSKQKDQEGKRTMLQLSQPRKPTASNTKEWYEPTDYPEKFEELYSYCIDDVDTECHLGWALGQLPQQEQKIWLLDQIINQRGVTIDVDLAHRCLSLIKEHTDKLKAEIKELTNGEVPSPSLVAKLLEWVKSQGVVASDMTKLTVEKLLADESLPSNVRRALEIRQSLSKSSTKKINSMLSCIGKDKPVVRYTMQYHGASTGRWSGRLIQVQNFPRGNLDDMDAAIDDLKELTLEEIEEKYGDIMDTISSCLRGMLIPSEGREFIVADFGAIEARIVMWYADEQDALQKFRDGADLYKDMAAYVYDKKVEDIDKEERHLGKGVILGCFEEDTPVLTHTGTKRIIDVRETDLLWDGVEWVSHQGLKYQGIKETKRAWGIGATLDHEILVDDTWQEWSEVTTKSSLGLKALNSVNLPLNDGNENTINMDALRASTQSVIVPVGDGVILIGTPLNQVGHKDAMYVLRKRLQPHAKHIMVMQISSPTTTIDKDSLIEYLRASNGATMKEIQTIVTMAAEELKCKKIGAKIGDYSWSTLSLWTDGDNPISNLTELMSTVDMKKEIYVSALVAKMQRTEGLFPNFKNESTNWKRKSSVYDILNAGPRNRFTIITSRGPLIVHNCGFGMGPSKFQSTCALQGLEIDFATAKKAIKAYREKYSNVPVFWSSIENAAINAVKTREPISTHKVTWQYETDKNFLSCLLPSGRKLYYYDPKIKISYAVKWIDHNDNFHWDKYDTESEAFVAKGSLLASGKCKTLLNEWRGDWHPEQVESLTHMGIDANTKQFVRQDTYGGKLVENIVQATARDCMVSGIFNIERKKYLTIMTIHDEIVAEIPKDEGSVSEFESLLAQTPRWADGLPLIAEGWRGIRYRK